jgi:hypothetical protein
MKLLNFLQAISALVRTRRASTPSFIVRRWSDGSLALDYGDRLSRWEFKDARCGYPGAIKERQMFHVTNGLFFERLTDGSVRLIKRVSHQENAPVLFEYTLNPNQWASVIASMSYWGEENEGFYRALKFHNGNGENKPSPIVAGNGT